jgi:hypothetical protein
MHDRNQLLRVSQRISGKLATSLQPGTDQERSLQPGTDQERGLGCHRTKQQGDQAVSALHTKWLRDALDGQAEVEFVDIDELGRNPAQIIPIWQQFLDTRLSASCTKPC